jgi:hypothetical protein
VVSLRREPRTPHDRHAKPVRYGCAQDHRRDLILSGHKLVTVRYDDPRPFMIVSNKLARIAHRISRARVDGFA